MIDALEWTFDHGWAVPPPAWVTALLDAYAAEDRLYGHGLRLSPTSARFDDDSRAWLGRLAPDIRARRYRHVTEHWGWSRTDGLARGAPMPLPSSTAVVAATIHAMRALADVAGVPVGLENLALAFSDTDVDAQPAMLGAVLDAIDGVLLLDLHNLWCQAINYRRDARALAMRYPLARVRQIHVAGGGSSSSAYGEPFRRDTHDAAVPDAVIDLLAWITPRCPALEAVILERLPHALADEPARARWRDELRTISEVVSRAAREPVLALREPVLAPREPVLALREPSIASATPPVAHALVDHAATTDELAAFQHAMAIALFEAADASAVRTALLAHPRFADQVVTWDLRALEVARALAVKWGVRAQATS